LKDLQGGLPESHHMGEDPPVKGPDDREVFQDIAEVKRVRIGKKAEPPFSLLGENRFGDLPVLGKDLIPDRDKFLIGEGKPKGFLQGAEKMMGRDFSRLVAVDDTLLGVEEKGEDPLRIGSFCFQGEPYELFRDLVMVERKDDIAQIVENDLNFMLFHRLTTSTILSVGTGVTGQITITKSQAPNKFQ
jgi:hypothetical protein